MVDQDHGVLHPVPGIVPTCQLLVVSFFHRPGSRPHGPAQGLPVRRPSASRQLSPQAARHCPGSSQGLRLPLQFLLRTRRLPQAADAALGAFPRPQGLSLGRGRAGQRHAPRTVATSRPPTVAILRRRPTHHCPLAGVLAGAASAGTVLGDRPRSSASDDRKHPPTTITSGRVPPRRRSLPVLGASPAFSRTDHDHSRPAERGHLTLGHGPQKMHVVIRTGRDIGWSPSLFTWFLRS
jgi:hypothetical protein